MRGSQLNFERITLRGAGGTGKRADGVKVQVVNASPQAQTFDNGRRGLGQGLAMFNTVLNQGGDGVDHAGTARRVQSERSGEGFAGGLVNRSAIRDHHNLAWAIGQSAIVARCVGGLGDATQGFAGAVVAVHRGT